MARLRRRGASDELNPWPGYVDALSTLIMVIVFVLLVFVLAQAFLSVALTGRDLALDRLNRQVSELNDILSLERGRAGELQLSAAQLGRDLAASDTARDGLARSLAAAREEGGRVAVDRDALRGERDGLAARLADAELRAGSASARTDALRARLDEAARRTDSAGQQAAALGGQLADARRQLAAAQAQAAGLRAAADEANRTVQADKATIEARLADIAGLSEQVRQLTALRAELEQRAQAAAVLATTEAERRAAVAAELGREQELSGSSRAQIALLTQQIDQLRAQVRQVAAALDLAEQGGRDKDAQVANLGAQLNVALASKVEELQRYRSEFFGRLRDVLRNRQDVQVVGDRFVFQSEVLFPPGSADMTVGGQEQIRALASTLKGIAADIPKDLNWILRVDGHADRQPTRGTSFASNWELSAQRAIKVVKLLVEEGVPANRLAATGFGEFQPLDRSGGAASFARNRRIELRLTDR